MAPNSTTDPATTLAEEPLLGPPPGFKSRPPRPPANDPLDPMATTITDPSDQPAGSSGDDEPEQLHATDSTTDKSSPASTRPEPAAELVNAFASVARVAVSLASIAVAKVREHKAGQAAGVWIAEDDEAAAIGDPLARIAARHVPLGEGASNPDVLDAIEAAMAAAGYAGTNARDEHELIAQLVREQGGAPPPDDQP